MINLENSALIDELNSSERALKRNIDGLRASIESHRTILDNLKKELRDLESMCSHRIKGSELIHSASSNEPGFTCKICGEIVE